MEESASAGVGLDHAGLAEAPKLVGSASQAMEGLAAQIQSGDGPRRCWWKVAGPELELLKTYMLNIWFISAAAGYKALALQARDATYFVDDLKDTIHECCKLHSTLARRAKILRHQFKLLPALWYCWNRMLGLLAPQPPSKIMRDIKVVNEETRRIGHLLQKGADPSCTSLPPPVSTREILQAKIRHWLRGSRTTPIPSPSGVARSSMPDPWRALERARVGRIGGGTNFHRGGNGAAGGGGPFRRHRGRLKSRTGDGDGLEISPVPSFLAFRRMLKIEPRTRHMRVM